MLLRPALMEWDGEKVSDHNRAPLNVTVEEIGKESRMANGRLRKYVVTRKRTWTCSWELLPDSNQTVFGMNTVDGGMAAGDIESFYNTHTGEFDLALYNGRGDVDRFVVMISEFSKEITKRSAVDLLTINVTLKEV